MQNFIDAAFEYKAKLAQATAFDDVRKLWSSTSIPYTVGATDPHSIEYKEAVECLYRKLSECDYQVSNELTSTKLDAASFETGYPWVSRNLDLIAMQIASTAQVFSALDRHYSGASKSLEVIEFGAGWGNLALPLARAGQAVTVVDIDEGFLSRIDRHCKRENLTIDLVHGDFCSVENRLDRRYDAAIFQSSFHHCLEFEHLLDILRDHVLKENVGKVFFFSEPISNGFNLPWGLRYDGESLWAIMCNKWLELGFREDFFNSLCLRKGFFLSRLPGIAPYIGEAWVARHGAIPFSEWALPKYADDSWHVETRESVARFSKGTSILPGLLGCHYKRYEVLLHNYSSMEMGVVVNDAGPSRSLKIPPASDTKLLVDADCEKVTISGTQFIPEDDLRLLSFAISNIRLL